MNWIIIQLSQKVKAIFYRCLDFFQWFPRRAQRWSRHWVTGLRSLMSRGFNWRHSAYWWTELSFYTLDVLGIAEVYETCMDFVKFNARSLSDDEIKLARTVFGHSINYRRVRIDAYSFFGPKQHHFCYVSFHFINSWGPMSNSVLLHELVHVWQYQNFGAVYMPKALAAQRSLMGYNYGGVQALYYHRELEKRFDAFNFEQQGDIIADYYRIREGYQPQWGKGRPRDLPVYEYFVAQLRPPGE